MDSVNNRKKTKKQRDKCVYLCMLLHDASQQQKEKCQIKQTLSHASIP